MKVDTITNEETVYRLETYLKGVTQRDYVIFKIGTNLGLRVSDFLDMPKDSQAERIEKGKKPYYTVQHFRDMCELGKVKLNQEKTDKSAYFDIPPDVKALMLEYMEGRDGDEPMFPSRMGGKALTRVGYHVVLKKACEILDIKENIGCHSMRKMFGYFHYKKYGNIRMLMEIFNHSKEYMTLKYIGVVQEEINMSMQNFSVGSFDIPESDVEAMRIKKKKKEEELRALKKKAKEQENKATQEMI